MTLPKRWAGSLTIGDGWAVFDGQAGENAPHAHLAHQLTSGKTKAITITCAGEFREVPPGQFYLIRSGQPHRIGPAGAGIFSLYLEPATLTAREASNPLSTVAERRTLPIVVRDLIASMTLPDDVIPVPAQKHVSGSLTRALIAELDRAIFPTKPRVIAEALGISSSQLRRLSKSAFGAPLTQVLQWRQLQQAAMALSRTASLAEAASAGGFADQAHFTRRMQRWFGVAPGAGLSGLEIRVCVPPADD